MSHKIPRVAFGHEKTAAEYRARAEYEHGEARLAREHGDSVLEAAHIHCARAYAEQARNRPVYAHDCEKCVYLGTIRARGEEHSHEAVDCYWCPSATPSLSSVIGRFGDNGPDYAASHPPESFAGGEDYYKIADRWYLFAMLQATLRGLYVKGGDK